MTTNQTIDGVSRALLKRIYRHLFVEPSLNRDDGKKLRALLDAPAKPSATAETVTAIICDICEHEPDDNPDSAHISIKALELILLQNLEGLIKPAAQPQGEPVACAHEWTDDGEFTLTCTKCGKTENHEPYGWVQTRGNAINHFTQEWDVVESWEDQGFEYKAMFDHAEQPAPVAVVRCSFCDITDQDGNPWSGGSATQDGILIYRVIGCKDHKHLADACLAEVTRLNPSL